LATVLRVRRIQQDAARADVGRAQAALGRATEEVDRRRAQLAASTAPVGGSAPAYLAAVTGRLALAADAAAARSYLDEARASLAERVDAWADTARRVRPLERLEEAHAESLRAAELRRGQALGDELAAAAWQRTRAGQAP
jgi:flagellar export protein FliJ